MLCEVKLHIPGVAKFTGGRFAGCRCYVWLTAQGLVKACSSNTWGCRLLSKRGVTEQRWTRRGSAVWVLGFKRSDLRARAGSVPFATSFSLKPTARCHHCVIAQRWRLRILPEC